AGGKRDESIRAGADRRFLEAVVAHALDVFPRHDEPGRAAERSVEHHEIRPRLLQTKAHTSGIGRLDRGDVLLEALRVDPAIPLERELDVLRGDRVAVVELDALA